MRNVYTVKALLGTIFGILMAAITPLAKASLPYPESDVTLLVIFFINYLVATFIADVVLHERTIKKGLTVFYPLEFIAWIAAFEALTRLVGTA